jgi:Tol biopolymer transport system component
MNPTPSATSDGTMYFEASRLDHPGTHIYRSRYVNGQYIEPELLNFAGTGNDINPGVASDGSFMILASRDRGGQGGSDLFISFANRDGTWTEPTNMGAINSGFAKTAPSLSPDNRTLYFASSRIDKPLIRTTPATYKRLEHELHEIQNGLINIYEVDLRDVRRFTER